MSLLANGQHQPRIPNQAKERKARDMHWNEPVPIEKLNWLIHLQHIRGETASCKELIKAELVRSNGKSEYAFFKQGIILREENKTLEALECFQNCLKLNPLNSEHIVEVAKCLYEMRRYRLALEAFLEAERVSRYPEWKTHHDIGLCYMRLDDIQKAKEYAHRAVTTGKQESSYALLMKILTAEGDYKSAVAVCNAAVTSCPDSVNMLSESGLLYLKMGQSQQAFERLSSALALDPTCVTALLGIGCIIQSHEEHDVALSKYKIAVQYEPDSVALWNNIGICFYSKQKYVAAISCLKRALWISPLNWKVLFNLGLVHLSTYQPASAFNFLCASVNLRPDVPNTFSVLGSALLELNDAHNALRAMKQALLLAPDDGMILANAALCSACANLFDQAHQLLNHFTALEDKNHRKEVLELIQELKSILAGDSRDNELPQNNYDGPIYEEIDGGNNAVTEEATNEREDINAVDQSLNSQITIPEIQSPDEINRELLADEV